MKPEELVELFAERPFQPLRLHMSNGRTHDIRHPEMAIVGEGVLALGVHVDGVSYPRVRLVPIPHINEAAPILTESA